LRRRQRPQAVVVGDERRVVAVRQRLIGAGFLVGALRYPTVPKGGASIRISVSLFHDEEDIIRLVDSLMMAIEEAE